MCRKFEQNAEQIPKLFVTQNTHIKYFRKLQKTKKEQARCIVILGANK